MLVASCSSIALLIPDKRLASPRCDSPLCPGPELGYDPVIHRLLKLRLVGKVTTLGLPLLELLLLLRDTCRKKDGQQQGMSRQVRGR